MYNKILVFFGVIVMCNAFPSGAPADACVRKKPNEPNHGASKPQDLATLPYEAIASTDKYAPGQEIQIQISGKENFRGFLLQARDAETDEWIGEFVSSPNTNVIPECSSITHADPKDKSGATFIWRAPQNKSGRVYFVGTIVKDYANFWTQVIAKIPVRVEHK